jgi:hypothetical protein
MLPQQRNQNVFLWALVALVPLVLIGTSFFVDHWGWGLMDDPGLVMQASQGWWSRTIGMFQALHNWGTFRFTYAAYVSFFYPLFHQSPQLFYLFKLGLVSLTLLLWGINARLLTGKSISVFLLPCVALSYYFFYDAFGYLSIQEPLGLFFGACAFLCFIIGALQKAQRQLPIHAGWLCAGVIFLILCVQSKEVFVSSALAAGVMLFLIFLTYKRKTLLFLSLVILLTATGYALYLKFCFQHAYSSQYDLTNGQKLLSNAHVWLMHSFVFHLPWALLWAIFAAGRFLKKEGGAMDRNARIGLITGAFNYALFLLLLLPWQVSDFYAIPLGLFFAFTLTMVLAPYLEELKGWPNKAIILTVLVLNLAVCYCSFGKMAAYRNDTSQLLDWLKYNEDFNKAADNGFTTATNAPEAGDRIPELLQMQTGRSIPHFAPMYSVKDIVYNQKVLYYLYNPTLGDQDLRLINRLFSVVYSSRSWTLFRKNDIFFSH